MKRLSFRGKRGSSGNRFDAVGGKVQPKLLLIIVAVIGFAWYLYANSPKPADEPVVQSGSSDEAIVPISRQKSSLGERSDVLNESETGSVEIESLASIDTAEGDSGAPSDTADATESMKEGDWARLIISELRLDGDGQADLQEAYENATAFAETGKTADAYLLHFFAAKHGYGPSALVLGTQADPEYHEPETGLMDEPNLSQAYKWYSQAARSGSREAKKRLDNLQSWVEKQAKQGNQNAQRILLQWR